MCKDKFKCKKCGQCCKNRGIIVVYPEDCEKISDYLHIKKEDFLQRYCDMVQLKINSGILEVWIMQINEQCVFLENNLCLINDVKPIQCAYGPTKYFTSIGSQQNCVQFEENVELNEKKIFPDEYFVKKLLDGYNIF